MSFEDDDNAELPRKSGLKNVSPQKSQFDSIQKKPKQEDLEKKVNVLEKNHSSNEKKIEEFFIKFQQFMKDQTVQVNQTISQREIEREFVQKLINLASQLNLDETEEESYGCLAIISFLLRYSFFQRNKMNDMEYEIVKIKKHLNLEK